MCGLDDKRSNPGSFQSSGNEQIHRHPRSTYARVDALRSTQTSRVYPHRVVLAERYSAVRVFETSLPTRRLLNRTVGDLTHLLPSDTVTSYPCKGTQRVLVDQTRTPCFPIWRGRTTSRRVTSRSSPD